MLPDIIVIGAMKCGTSSLHRYLDVHPDISMSKKKEVDFFIDRKNWTKGLCWYQNQFHGEAKLYGESSPNYTMYPTFQGVPERMHSVVPNAKLIYVVRDPIERLVSHYQHQWYDGRKSQTLEQTLNSKERNHYLATCSYYNQIEQFLKFYPASQLLVLSVEQLKLDRDLTMHQVFEFLGVDPNVTLDNLESEYHKTSDKVRVTGPLSFLQSKSGAGQVFRKTVRAIVPSSMLKKAGQILTKKPDVALSETTLQSLKDELKPDVEKLRAYSGLSLDKWSV
ncbi:sulfotransferase family protein [Echinimonas agarilytica]|uniref:Sulfotransferase domain-containing protein n=1 Tax=Echinimonas agarilytica TaxID=1215918 RepID=A0AA41WC94_9GAMM|nr:sulfotransferase [Echinimonas agarilytica]MCM2681486.1 sulfotransferase domain-containing protein [Echinimonas agarilytica]